jgi:hypothetical protein
MFRRNVRSLQLHDLEFVANFSLQFFNIWLKRVVNAIGHLKRVNSFLRLTGLVPLGKVVESGLIRLFSLFEQVHLEHRLVGRNFLFSIVIILTLE